MPHLPLSLPHLQLPAACETCPARQKDCPADAATKLNKDHGIFVRHSTPENPYTQFVAEVYGVDTDPVTAHNQLSNAAAHLALQAKLCSRQPEPERPIGTIGLRGIRSIIQNHNPHN